MPQPRLIPVLDVMGGVVVRAVGGRRDEYRPIESRITPATDPVQVAAALLQLTGASELYVADLDAIRGGQDVSPQVARLVREILSPFWVDIGIGPQQPSSLLPKSPQIRPIIGLETASDPGQLTAMLAACGSRPVAFSLDMKGGNLLGNWAAWGVENERDARGLVRRVVELGVRTLIVLDLARVGTGTGSGTEPLLRAIRDVFPDIELIAGGGVRTWADIDRLGEAGANAVLVASALHDGTLTFPRPSPSECIPTRPLS